LEELYLRSFALCGRECLCLDVTPQVFVPLFGLAFVHLALCQLEDLALKVVVQVVDGLASLALKGHKELDL